MTEALSPRVYEQEPRIDIPKDNELTREIDYFRNYWYEEDLPHNWRDLPGTGFIVSSQMELLRHGDKETWLEQTEEDVKGFVVEYLAQGLTFPIFYRIEKVNGQDRVVAPHYGNKLMVDTVSDEERSGVVKDTLKDKIEPFLLSSPDSSIAVMTSPPGPSGLKGSNGREIVYPDSQTYILQKNGNEIVGFTIRTDFDQDEHRQFIERLGGRLPEEASIEDFVEETVFLNSEDSNLDISDIVFSMQQARRESTGNIFAYKNRLWDEVYLDLLRREELWRFDYRTGQIFEQFKNHIGYQELDEESTKEALAVTILRIARFLRPGEEPKVTDRVSLGYILQEVQKIPGCAGGGSSGPSSFINSLTPRFGIEDDGFKCPSCHKKADGPVGNKCPSCGITKEEWAQKSSEVC